MKFVREVTKEGLKIPVAATKLVKMEANDKADLFVSEDGMILLKRKMTAMELIRASQYLHKIASELIVHLALACGFCEDCDDCCPCEDLEEDGIALPDYLREEAGIPDSAKLCAFVDEESGSVIITTAEHEHDLTDVPTLVIDMLVNSGVCLGALEEHLIRGDVVYGRE